MALIYDVQKGRILENGAHSSSRKDLHLAMKLVLLYKVVILSGHQEATQLENTTMLPFFEKN